MKIRIYLFFLFFTNIIFCQKSIDKIPESSLYYFYDLSILENDSIVQIRYPEETKHNYKHYYNQNQSNPIINNKKVTKEYFDNLLKRTIELKLVDKKIKKRKIYNKHLITNNTYIKTKNNGDFYLTIKNNKDSILFKDTPVEAYIKTYRYIGDIEYLNSYLVESFFEQPTHLLINKKNGNKKEISFGFPNFSPNGEFLIDIFLNSATYQNDESSNLNLYKKNEKNQLVLILTVNFKSWCPSPNYKDFFWISEKEIVFKVYPIRKYIKSYGKEIKGQYIKLKIL